MADSLFTKALYNTIFTAGNEIGKRSLIDECTRFQPSIATGRTTGEEILDQAVGDACRSEEFNILASFDVFLTGDRRLFVCRFLYTDATGVHHTNTFKAWIEPDTNVDNHGADNIRGQLLTPGEEDVVRRLIESIDLEGPDPSP